MKFVCVFIFIMFWQTTFTVVDGGSGIFCYVCNLQLFTLNERNKCVVNPGATIMDRNKFERECPVEHAFCYIMFDDTNQVVKRRYCFGGSNVSEGCAPHSSNPKYTECRCRTERCNDKTFPTQVASLTKFRCINCPSRQHSLGDYNQAPEIDCLLNAEPSYSEDCLGKGFICATHIDSSSLLITSRRCEKRITTPIFEDKLYVMNDCVQYGEKFYCACQTDDCNNKMPPQLIPQHFPPPPPAPPAPPSPSVGDTHKPGDTAASNPDLMCYQCEVSSSSDCLQPTTTDLFVKKCAEYSWTLDARDGTWSLHVTTKGDDYYCTSEFVNDKAVSRGCKRRKHLPHSGHPLKCLINETHKSCACKTSKCNYYSSFPTDANHVGVHNGFFIGILTSMVVLSLVK